MSGQGITGFRTHRLGTVRGLDPLTVEQEAAALQGLALALTESVHKLLEGCRSFDLEKDLIVVISNFDIEVFGRRGRAALIFRLIFPTW